MINLISISNFTQPFLVFGGDEISTKKLDEIITESQNDFLLEVLGNELLYELNQDNSGNLPTTQKWIDFLSGLVYVIDTKIIDYKGFNLALKYYVFIKYNEWSESQLEASGEVVLQLNNSKQVSPKRKLIDASIKLVELTGNYYNWIYAPTCYNYLTDTDNFGALNFGIFKQQLRFGI